MSQETTTKTNFQKVRDFNIAFGISRSDQENPDIFNENPKLVKLRLDLIKEETQELRDAYQQRDIIEIIDALADIEYVLHGCADSFGIDLDKWIVEESRWREKSIKKIKAIPVTLTRGTLVFHNVYDCLEEDQENKTRKTKECHTEFLYLVGLHQGIVNQLEVYIEKKDFDGVRTSLVNLYDSITTLSECTGIDINFVFDLVHQSNMSKLCSTKEEAETSVQKYLDEPEKRYDSPCVRDSPLDGKFVVHNASTGKALKSHLYKEVTPDIRRYLAETPL